MKRHAFAIPGFVILAALWAQASVDQPKLGQVIERIGRYVDHYGDRLSVIVGVERYDQQQSDPPAERQLVSEIAFVPVRGDWLVYRDVFEVDGKQVGDRTDRLRKLLVESPQAGLEQARRIADESARYNLGPVQRNLNTPTMCLFAMRSENLDRFKFRKEGEERIADEDVWKIRFEEKHRPTIVRTPEGRDLPMAGNLWVRPSDGAVVKTGMAIPFFIGKVPSRASVTVAYAIDARLKTLLPVTMDERYGGELAEAGGERVTAAATTIACRAAYSDFKKFETSSRLVIPK